MKQTSDLLSLSPLRHSDGFASCKARCVLISASLPKAPFPGERLCMLCWLCICSIVVVCCRCVLHRLCSTTCMRPYIEPLGVLSRHPCRNPKPLPRGEGLCMLCWLCIVQSLWAYTPGVRAGLSVGLPPSPRLGLRPKPHFQKYIGFSTD